MSLQTSMLQQVTNERQQAKNVQMMRQAQKDYVGGVVPPCVLIQEQERREYPCFEQQEQDTMQGMIT